MRDEKKRVPELRFPEFHRSWEARTLEGFSSKISDGIHGTPIYSTNGRYYFVNGNNLSDGVIIFTPRTKRIDDEEAVHHKRDLGSRTILISINGTIGNLALYDGEHIILGKSACYFNVKEGISKHFVFQLLKTSSINREFMSKLTGSTIKNLGLGSIKMSRCLAPHTTDEQKKIADFLGAVDEKINLLRKKRELLERYKRGLMQKLFSQELRFRQDDGSPFPDWEETLLDNVSSRNQYGMNQAAVSFDGAAKYIRITDIDENTRLYKQVSLVSPKDGADENYRLEAGDLLFARTGASVGKSYLYNVEDGALYFAGFLIRFSLDQELVDPSAFS